VTRHKEGYQPSTGGPVGPTPSGGSSARWPELPAQRHIIEFSPAVNRALERIADAIEGLSLSAVTAPQEMGKTAADVALKAQVDKALADLAAAVVDAPKPTRV
jgi:hypothetical protein